MSGYKFCKCLNRRIARETVVFFVYIRQLVYVQSNDCNGTAVFDIVFAENRETLSEALIIEKTGLSVTNLLRFYLVNKRRKGFLTVKGFDAFVDIFKP